MDFDGDGLLRVQDPKLENGDVTLSVVLGRPKLVSFH